MPILILQGADDTIVPQQITDVLFDRLCETVSQTDYRVFEGLGHGEAFLRNFAPMPDIVPPAPVVSPQPTSETVPGANTQMNPISRARSQARYRRG